MGIKNPGLRGYREDSFLVRVRHSWSKVTPLVAVRALQQLEFLEWFRVRSSEDWTCHLRPGIKSVRTSHILILPLQMLTHTLVKPRSSLPPSRYQTVLTFKTATHWWSWWQVTDSLFCPGVTVWRDHHLKEISISRFGDRSENRVKSSAQYLAGPGIEFWLSHWSASCP